jgi:hypothetical protein
MPSLRARAEHRRHLYPQRFNMHDMTTTATVFASVLGQELRSALGRCSLDADAVASKPGMAVADLVRETLLQIALGVTGAQMRLCCTQSSTRQAQLRSQTQPSQSAIAAHARPDTSAPIHVHFHIVIEPSRVVHRGGSGEIDASGNASVRDAVGPNYVGVSRVRFTVPLDVRNEEDSRREVEREQLMRSAASRGPVGPSLRR